MSTFSRGVPTHAAISPDNSEETHATNSNECARGIASRETENRTSHPGAGESIARPGTTPRTPTGMDEWRSDQHRRDTQAGPIQRGNQTQNGGSAKAAVGGASQSYRIFDAQGREVATIWADQVLTWRPTAGIYGVTTFLRRGRLVADVYNSTGASWRKA